MVSIEAGFSAGAFGAAVSHFGTSDRRSLLFVGQACGFFCESKLAPEHVLRRLPAGGRPDVSAAALGDSLDTRTSRNHRSFSATVVARVSAD